MNFLMRTAKDLVSKVVWFVLNYAYLGPMGLLLVQYVINISL